MGKSSGWARVLMGSLMVFGALHALIYFLTPSFSMGLFFLPLGITVTVCLVIMGAWLMRSGLNLLLDQQSQQQREKES